jgi:hypothetical protein
MAITLDGTTGITTPGLTNTGTETIVNLTTTGNTTLGDATTDTLTVGVTGIVKDASGNVGIGTASPSGKLDVATDGNTTAYLTYARNANAGSSAYAISGWGNNSSSNAGQVAISSTANTSYGGGGDFIFLANTGDMTLRTTTAKPMTFYTNSAERMRIDSTGIISSVSTYNNTTASGANAVFQSNGGFQRSTSALKYKQDIRNLESIDITQFRPVRYKSKCDGDDQTKDHFGIIADEVDAIGIKELVTYNADGEVEGFQYERLTVILLKEIQELKALSDAQASTITALTARITALEAQNTDNPQQGATQ